MFSQNVFLPAGDGSNGTVGLSGYVSDVFGAEARTIAGADRVTPVTVSVVFPVGGDVDALLTASVGSLVCICHRCFSCSASTHWRRRVSVPIPLRVSFELEVTTSFVASCLVPLPVQINDALSQGRVEAVVGNVGSIAQMFSKSSDPCASVGPCPFNGTCFNGACPSPVDAVYLEWSTFSPCTYVLVILTTRASFVVMVPGSVVHGWIAAAR